MSFPNWSRDWCTVNGVKRYRARNQWSRHGDQVETVRSRDDAQEIEFGWAESLICSRTPDICQDDKPASWFTEETEAPSHWSCIYRCILYNCGYTAYFQVSGGIIDALTKSHRKLAKAQTGHVPRVSVVCDGSRFAIKTNIYELQWITIVWTWQTTTRRQIITMITGTCT